MTLPDLNKKMSMFRIGRVILCQKPLCHNGFWRSYYRGHYVTKQMQTGRNQDAKRAIDGICPPAVSLGYGFMICHS